MEDVGVREAQLLVFDVLEYSQIFDTLRRDPRHSRTMHAILSTLVFDTCCFGVLLSVLDGIK